MYDEKYIKFLLVGYYEGEHEVSAEIFFKVMDMCDIHMYSGQERGDGEVKNIVFFDRMDSGEPLGKIIIRDTIFIND